MSLPVINAQALSAISTCFLAPETDFKALLQAKEQFSKILADITGLDIDKTGHRGNLALASGKSIGPAWAAGCLDDLLRTKKFVRGLYLGIRAAQQRFPGTRIHILYAGTGPFATLALPMTQVFSPAEIKFTFLEIHPTSFSMLQKTIEFLQMEAYLHALVLADATQFQRDPLHPVHVLVSETMQQALKNEPQVAITMNLGPQLIPEGILIPECIDVWAGLLDPKRYMQNKYRLDGQEDPQQILLKKIFSLNRSLFNDAPENGWFAPASMTLAPAQVAQFPILALFTDIQVFGAEKLRGHDSPLSLPLMLHDFQEGITQPKKVVFQYEMGVSPGFRTQMFE
jgi:hypothetical protein